MIPDQGTENNVWGTDLATVFNNAGAPNGIDQVVKTVQTTANAALPTTGGTMSGLANQFTETVHIVAKGNINGATTFDLSTAQYFTCTATAGVTVSLSNVPATANAAIPLIFRITNGAVGTWNWMAGSKFIGGVAPVLSNPGTDMVAFISDDAGSTWRLTMFAKGLA